MTPAAVACANRLAWTVAVTTTLGLEVIGNHHDPLVIAKFDHVLLAISAERQGTVWVGVVDV